MKRLTALFVVIMILAPATTFSQTRKKTSRPAARVAQPAKTSEAFRQGAMRVADEIKTMTRFLYLLGGVTKGIESMDDAARRNEATPNLLDQVTKNKLTVKSSIQTIRERLDKLEIDFRATPDLQRYYIKLAGSASGAAAAEQQASANQFDQAGRSLLSVVNRLTDVLFEMRQQ